MWRPSKTRKARSDSKLHGLGKEQRALVDKWLFDKGLTYQAVSEACLQMFGLKVSKSSVGRYHERELRQKVRRVSGKAREWVKERKALTAEQMYQETLGRMVKWALEEIQWPVEDERDVKGVLRVMRILISARRERNEADMAKLAREKFEMKAGRQCLHLMLKRKEGLFLAKAAKGATERMSPAVCRPPPRRVGDRRPKGVR
jgi:hypothetical protein